MALGHVPDRFYGIIKRVYFVNYRLNTATFSKTDYEFQVFGFFFAMRKSIFLELPGFG